MTLENTDLSNKNKSKGEVRPSTPTKDMGDSKDVYTRVTNTICEALENGVVAWRKPWKARKGGFWQPVNFMTRKPYNGINVFLLGLSPFGSRFWLTYTQAIEMGGQVRKGERGTLAIRYGQYEKKTDDFGANGEEVIEKTAFLKSFFLFNLDQIDGIEDPEEIQQGEAKDVNPLEFCESIISGFNNRPTIQHEGDRAFYRASIDTVTMPDKWRFESSEEYYSTFFHELAHSTGHESRLNREGFNVPHHFGDAIYSKEELVAEMTASFLCARACIEQTTISNSAAYIASWLKVLRDNKKILISAAAQAQKAAAHILTETLTSNENAHEGMEVAA